VLLHSSCQRSAISRQQKHKRLLAGSAKFVRFVKFTDSISLAAMAERLFAANSPLTLSGGVFSQYLPEGGLRRQNSLSFIAGVIGRICGGGCGGWG
jgi:hypothetical protein